MDKFKVAPSHLLLSLLAPLKILNPLIPEIQPAQKSRRRPNRGLPQPMRGRHNRKQYWLKGVRP